MEIKTDLDFDKQDVVTVAMAKIEAKIRKSVREAKATARIIEEEIRKSQVAIPEIGKKAIPTGMKNKMKILSKALTSAKLGKNARWEIIHSLRGALNRYNLTLYNLDENDNPINGTRVLTEETKFSKEQNDHEKNIDKNEEKLAEARQEGITWKAKLSDMPAAERQMRAIVVENQLKKSKEGKALVDLIVAQYENSIKLLEM